MDCRGIWLGLLARTLSLGLLWLVGFGSSLSVSAACASAYDCAAERLESGEFAEARQAFRAVLEAGPSAAAYQGYAEACLAIDDVPGATWGLRNAELLGGTATLKSLEQRVYADLPSDLVPLPLGGVDGLAGYMSRLAFPNLPALLALLGLAIAAVLSIRQIGHRRDQPFSTQWPAITGALLLAFLSSWIAFRQNTLARAPAAVSVAESSGVVDTLAIRTAPSPSAPSERTLPSGVVVETGETLSGYTEVVLPTGERGWLPTDRLWPIRPLEPVWHEGR